MSDLRAMQFWSQTFTCSAPTVPLLNRHYNLFKEKKKIGSSHKTLKSHINKCKTE